MLKRKVGYDDEEPVFSASKKRLKQDTCQGAISDSSKRKLWREEYTVGWFDLFKLLVCVDLAIRRVRD